MASVYLLGLLKMMGVYVYAKLDTLVQDVRFQYPHVLKVLVKMEPHATKTLLVGLATTVTAQEQVTRAVIVKSKVPVAFKTVA